ncbi:Uncharacterized protein FKW44_007706, partial [Caligus rogercresseyi]
DGEIIITQEHSHPPDHLEVEAKKIRSKIKEMALNTHTTPSILVNDCLSKSSTNIFSKLPKRESLNQTVRRAHPSTLSTENLNMSIGGEEFLMLETENIAIYSTKNNLNTS